MDYRLLAAQAEALLSGQRHRIANAANLSALVYRELPDVNWVGFYFLEDEALILGPFQGKPACVSIPLGHGVCGTAAATGKVQCVADVHAFDGHIVCDADSRSELVVPLVKDDMETEVGVPIGLLQSALIAGKPFNIDAKLNGAYVALGLLYGAGDFDATLRIATRAGQDSDCNPASAGGTLGSRGPPPSTPAGAPGGNLLGVDRRLSRRSA